MSLPNLSSDAIDVPANRENSSIGEFIDRRNIESSDAVRRTERRQFGSAHFGLSDDGRDLALAIDKYKVEKHRRYLTCDEILQVLSDLGYQKVRT